MIGIYNNAQSTSFPVYTYGEIVGHIEAPASGLYSINYKPVNATGRLMVGGKWNATYHSWLSASSTSLPIESIFVNNWSDFYYYSRYGYETIYYSSYIGIIGGTIEEVCGDIEVGMSTMFSGCTSLKRATFPYLSELGESAFLNCGSLTYVSIPNLNEVRKGTFSSCRSLSGISLPKCSSVGSYAFYTCVNMSYVDISSCRYVGGYAFHNCTSITSIDMPLCSTVMNYAFDYCPNIEYVNLPSCMDLREGAFYCCSALKSITLPCISIPNIAFGYNSALKRAEFMNCSEIGLGVFWDCRNLSELVLGWSSVVTVNVNPISISDPMCDPFYSTKLARGQGSIYVRSSLVNAYKTAVWWSSMSSIIFPIPS